MAAVPASSSLLTAALTSSGLVADPGTMAGPRCYLQSKQSFEKYQEFYEAATPTGPVPIAWPTYQKLPTPAGIQNEA
jgi:hypothetical protein